jgi:cell division protease FtsH
MGAERRSMIMSDEEKRITAFHEAGHALVALLSPEADPVHKVTIIPRGMALGLTQTLPEEDRHNYTRDEMTTIIKYAMGGRAAEEIVFQHFSTGASNDLQRATRLARDMVCTYGMSEAIGPVSFEEENGDVFLGRDYMTRKNYSEKTAELIDGEVKRLLTGLYEEAKALLAANRATLDRIADALLERETLEQADLQKLLAGQALPPLPSPSGAPAGPKPAKPTRTREPAGVRGELPDPEPIAG